MEDSAQYMRLRPSEYAVSAPIGARLSRLVPSLMLAVAIVLLGGCQGRVLMPTPNLYVGSATDPFANVPPALQSADVDLLYLTDRVPEEKHGRLEYSFGRSRSAAFGSCIVAIGRDIEWAELAEQSRLRKRDRSLPLRVEVITELGRLPETPLPLVERDGVVMQDPQVLELREKIAEKFRNELQRRLDLAPSNDVLLFVHGYNNSFEDAAMTLAELWHFLGRESVPVLYTWPAGHGGLKGYAYDRESGDFTLHHLKNALRFLASCPEVEGIHLLGHSRGTDILISALRELFNESRAAGRDPRSEFRIKNLILAAADIDFEVAAQKFGADRTDQGVQRLTLYVSPEDKALGIAGWFFDSVQRVGGLRYEDLPSKYEATRAILKDTYIIDARGHTDFWGHSYFHSSPAVSSDLILLLRHGFDPGAENGRPLERIGTMFWELPPDYPRFDRNGVDDE